MVHRLVVGSYVTFYVFFCTAFGLSSLLKSVSKTFEKVAVLLTYMQHMKTYLLLLSYI